MSSGDPTSNHNQHTQKQEQEQQTIPWLDQIKEKVEDEDEDDEDEESININDIEDDHKDKVSSDEFQRNRQEASSLMYFSFVFDCGATPNDDSTYAAAAAAVAATTNSDDEDKYFEEYASTGDRNGTKITSSRHDGNDMSINYKEENNSDEDSNCFQDANEIDIYPLNEARTDTTADTETKGYEGGQNDERISFSSLDNLLRASSRSIFKTVVSSSTELIDPQTSTLDTDGDIYNVHDDFNLDRLINNNDNNNNKKKKKKKKKGIRTVVSTSLKAITSTKNLVVGRTSLANRRSKSEGGIPLVSATVKHREGLQPLFPMDDGNDHNENNEIENNNNSYHHNHNQKSRNNEGDYSPEEIGKSSKRSFQNKEIIEKEESTPSLLSTTVGENDSKKGDRNKNDNDNTRISRRSFGDSQDHQPKIIQKKKGNTKPRNTLPVKCAKKTKSAIDFNPLLLISTLVKAHEGPIYRSSFSKDGNYLATAGKDGLLNIWQIAPTRQQVEDMSKKEGHPKTDSARKGCWNEDDENTLPTAQGECDAVGTEVKFILTEPIQSFKEHTDHIMDLSWSHTDYLLSASLDTSVRLWHPTQSTCLILFKHPDKVTSVSFHPSTDRYFVSGGNGKRVRFWSTPDCRLIHWCPAPAKITAATFQPDGEKIAVGLIDGKVIFYTVDGNKLEYFTQILCKNRNKKLGKRVTGLAFKQLKKIASIPSVPIKKETSFNKALKFMKTKVFTSLRRKKKYQEQILITSNDSRLRLFGMHDFCPIRKYKGHSNSMLMSRARFNESGDFVIIGSLKGKCIVWNTASPWKSLRVITGINMYDKVKRLAWFKASTADPPIITEALFSPSASTKKALLHSGLFPSLHDLDHIHHDFSSAMIVTCDCQGTMRVFLRRASFDAVVQHAANPESH